MGSRERAALIYLERATTALIGTCHAKCRQHDDDQSSGGIQVSYQPGKALDPMVEQGIAVLGPSRKEMDRLIVLMGGLKLLL